MEQTIEYAIELDPDFANFYPAVPYPGTALYDKCVRESLLPPERGRLGEDGVLVLPAARQRPRRAASVMDAINRAKRRFFLRPGYMARHVGDVARRAHEAEHRVAGADPDAVRHAGRRHVAAAPAHPPRR